MKSLFYRISLFMSLCCMIFVACENNELEIVQAEEDTTSVTLRIAAGTGEPSVGTRYVDASQYEGIRTLRVIVTTGSGEDREIVYNDMPAITGGNSSVETITIPHVPIGETMFYVVANEASLGKSYTDEQIREDLVSNGKVLFVDEQANRHFPKLGPDIAQDGLPMTGRQAVKVSKDMQPVNIEMERAVVKLSLTVENVTASDIELTSVKFGPFSGDRLYLFPEYNLDVPDNAQYTEFGYENQSISIAAGGKTDKLSAYIYPTYAYMNPMGDNPYTLALSTNVKEYEALVFAPNHNSFRRNTQVNITARITTAVGITLNFEVTDWDEYPIEVPPFE